MPLQLGDCGCIPFESLAARPDVPRCRAIIVSLMEKTKLPPLRITLDRSLAWKLALVGPLVSGILLIFIATSIYAIFTQPYPNSPWSGVATVILLAASWAVSMLSGQYYSRIEVIGEELRVKARWGRIRRYTKEKVAEVKSAFSKGVGKCEITLIGGSRIVIGSEAYPYAEDFCDALQEWFSGKAAHSPKTKEEPLH